MVLKKGKVTDRYRFSLAGTTIPSITEQPVKSLGKLFDSSLKDTASIQRTSKELGGWLRCVDRSGLPGRFKAWIYQHSILPRILWPLLVYAVPMTTVEDMERKISRLGKLCRHDQVLKAVAESIAKAINTTKGHSKPKTIRFHRAGEKPTIPAGGRLGLLTTATDWQLEVDLDKQLKIPSRITSTRLRPDMIIVSDSTKQLIILELTVPWEERMEEANERKRAKYQELVEECRSQGWKTYCEPLEVGCRGFAGRSLCKVLTMLGLTSEAKRKAIRSATEAAERATRWLWIKRADPWMNAAGTQAGV
ncbi:reverse transcriptase [Labeo rohita]|uniref:Reverse transcriptase n=1 Tax=Labeo rohita TaxID=84645 RepID=A0A498NF83_LABRO|nr:reverse transcriptase [Labeo rohita]